MYMDKLDGRVTAAFFDRKAAEWRAEQDRIQRTIEEHQSANQSYLEEGVRLLEIANRSCELFRRQPPSEKRRLLNFMVSNCTWKDGKLSATFRQPFDMMPFALRARRQTKPRRRDSGAHFENWLPFVHTYRTLCIAPPPEVKKHSMNFVR
jgi:hypothetical protein